MKIWEWKDFTSAAGGTLAAKTEEVKTVLAAIKILAVIEENAMVARVTSHEMNKIGTNPFDLLVSGSEARLVYVCKFLS